MPAFCKSSGEAEDEKERGRGERTFDLAKDIERTDFKWAGRVTRHVHHLLEKTTPNEFIVVG